MRQAAARHNDINESRQASSRGPCNTSRGELTSPQSSRASTGMYVDNIGEAAGGRLVQAFGHVRKREISFRVVDLSLRNLPPVARPYMPGLCVCVHMICSFWKSGRHGVLHRS
jgi:hypothetical protein